SLLLLATPPLHAFFLRSLHDALPISPRAPRPGIPPSPGSRTIVLRWHPRTGRAAARPAPCAPGRVRACVWPRAATQGHRVPAARSEEHTSELQSRDNIVCRRLLEKNK